MLAIQSLDFSRKLELLFCLVLFSLPVISPYMRAYDLSVFVVPFGFFPSKRKQSEKVQGRGDRLVSTVAILFIAIIDLVSGSGAATVEDGVSAR
ncbi:MAG: hypothetical protein R3D26_18055 [Cyanobacteriota/Melainabacteria group bacterium]